MRTGLLVAIVAVVIYNVATLTMAIPGGEWSPVPTTLGIQDLGRWAVTEHVKKANDGIKFIKVVSAKSNDDNFDLIIEASNSNGKDAKYEAEVYVMDLDAQRTRRHLFGSTHDKR
ncbi:hypothetical protein HU200_054757 [Digitaria exilis]|uniref:Cystatin domain-containing protein n=1 Tax=Digitaria exilis TaxID=1010633 RepID=A0A835AKX5_9POAL|nr:hypothetical protein HU200_054757 [Digitaria exilis]